MRDRLYLESSPIGELEGDRLRFAGMPMELLTGGAGMGSPGTNNYPPQNANGAVAGIASSVQPHHGVISLVLVAVLILFLLDRGGFRFAVTAGRR